MTTKHRQCNKITFEQLEGILRKWSGLPKNQWIYNITINPDRNVITIYTTNGLDTENPEAHEIMNIPLNFQEPEEIKKLRERDRFLTILEAHGVDNWEWFHEAKKEFHNDI